MEIRGGGGERPNQKEQTPIVPIIKTLVRRKMKPLPRVLSLLRKKRRGRWAPIHRVPTERDAHSN